MNNVATFVVIFMICVASSRQWRPQRLERPHRHYFTRNRAFHSPRAIPNTSRVPVYSEAEDPCAPYTPPLPNFTAPGRRISEVKCFEYIWQLKVRDDKAHRRQNCSMLRSRSGLALNVVGGQRTYRGDYPHMGAIGWNSAINTWKFICGCSLISPRFVLTAAHCSYASERDTTIADSTPKIVRLGDRNIADEDENGNIITHYDVAIVEIILNPNYKSPKQYFDIALMKLGEEVQFNMDVQPGCLWSIQNLNMQNEGAEVAGWGITESGTLKTSTELLAAQVDLINATECDFLLQEYCNRNWCGLQEHQLCAGKMSGEVDSCQGDSGGPLSVKIPLPVTSQGTMHFIVGVTSFGVSCALPRLPGVYTRVSSFLDWIENIVWPTTDYDNENKINFDDK